MVPVSITSVLALSHKLELEKKKKRSVIKRVNMESEWSIRGQEEWKPKRAEKIREEGDDGAGRKDSEGRKRKKKATIHISKPFDPSLRLPIRSEVQKTHTLNTENYQIVYQIFGWTYLHLIVWK